MLRSAIERLFRDFYLWRRLPNGIAIAVSPDARLNYLSRSFDRDLIELAIEHVGPDSVVWDIGANCGTFTFSSIHGREVVAVEADPFLCSLLEKTAARGITNVSVVKAAISDHIGISSFSIAARGRASNHLSDVAGSTQSGGERDRIEVETRTLDSLLENHSAPTFVKIDIEHAELAALQGAERLLSEARPVIYIELGHKADECLAIFARHNYDARVHHGTNWIAAPL